MRQKFDLIIRGGIAATPSGIAAADIGVRSGRIAAIGALGGASAETEFDAKGLHVLPGVIDSQVHFREPGNEHKEDLESGSRAAVLGGVTAVFEMPNTYPPTTTRLAIEDKLARARNRMHCDYAFYVGATPQNVGALATLERLPGVAGVKAFLGSSTGTLLLSEEDSILAALKGGSRRMAVHSEDEARLEERKSLAVTGDPRSHPLWRDVETARLSTERVLRLAKQAGRRLHVLHVTTADELPLLAAARDYRDGGDDAAASHIGRARMLRAPRHLCPDEPAHPRSAASRCTLARRAGWTDRRHRIGSCAPHARGKKQDLSRYAIGHARCADAGNDPSRSCRGGPADA